MEEIISQKVAEGKEAWEAGRYAGLLEAFIWCAGNGLPLPRWMYEPILEQLQAGYLGKPVPKKGGRGKGHPVVEEGAARVHAVRWSLATQCLKMKNDLPRFGKPATRAGAFEFASEGGGD